MPFVYFIKNPKTNALVLWINTCSFQNLIGDIFSLYNFSLISIDFFFYNMVTLKTICSNFMTFLNRRLCNLLYSIITNIIHTHHSSICNTISIIDEQLNNYRHLQPTMPHFITAFFWTKEGILHLYYVRNLVSRISAYHTQIYPLKHGPSHPTTYLCLFRKDKSRNASFSLRAQEILQSHFKDEFLLLALLLPQL